MQELGTHDMQYYNVGGVVKTDRVRSSKRRLRYKQKGRNIIHFRRFCVIPH